MSNLIHLHQKLAGRYKFRVLKSDRTLKHETDWSDNLITNNGLEFLGTAPSAAWSFCSVGSGTTAPAFTDNQLQTRIATTNTTIGSPSVGTSGAPDYYIFRAVTFEFAAGTAAGNLSEVGVGRLVDGTQLQSRALIVDGGGSPTTITVLADEILQVTFERRQYAPAADLVSTVTISGTVYEYTLRASSVTSYGSSAWTAELDASIFNTSTNVQRAFSGSIGAITGSPSGTAGPSTSIVTNTYSANSYERTGKITWGLDKGNLVGGIKSVQFTAQTTGTYQAEFTPALPKDNTKILELNVKHSWGRV